MIHMLGIQCSCGINLGLDYHPGEGWRLNHDYPKDEFPTLEVAMQHYKNGDHHVSRRILADLKRQAE